MFSSYRCLIALLIAVAGSFVEAADPAPKSPLEPTEAIRQFVLPAGFRIELVASEPQVVDPVAMRFDEQGRLWVAEYRDYPNGPAEGEAPKSRIKLLEDRDGDGRYETSHVFADKLLFCNGIQPWAGGMIATVAGQLIYLQDTDGDNRADKQTPWFTGFVANNPQLRLNHPRFAMDNHIYVASGLSGGEVHNERLPKSDVITIRNCDFRFDPRSGAAEIAAGNGQFGMTFDDYGNRFLVHNRRPLFEVMLEERYLGRNKLLAIPAVVQDVAAQGEESHIYPISQFWTTSHLHAGQFTAACGADIYRGDALPQLRGNSFTCDPTGNLVHREVLEPNGASFKAHPAYEKREFLATRDSWCRPVAIESGPDGALYVVDMYRAVIEHPQFMPIELKNRPDLRYGDDRGRIYRIVPTDWNKPWSRPQLAKASTAELVKQLESRNAWWRETAARLLYERQDQAAVADLTAVASSAKQAYSRVHALWLLAGLERLSDTELLAALADSEPRVREHGVRLAEDRLGENDDLRDAVIALAGDADPRLRFQVALSLGNVKGVNLAQPLASIALEGASDPWTRRAVETALADGASGVLIKVCGRLGRQGHEATEDQLLLVGELALLVGSSQDAKAISGSLAVIGDHETPTVIASAVLLEPSDERLALAVLDGIARGLRSRGTVFTSAKEGSAFAAVAAGFQRWFDRAAKLAGSADTDTTLRKEAIELLAYAPYSIAGPVLSTLVEREPSQPLRLAAVTALSAQRDPGVGAVFLDQLSSQTPAVRSAMLDALLSQTERMGQLLDRIEAGEIKPREIDTVRANRLVNSRDKTIQGRARKLLASALPADRAEAMKKYEACLELKTDPLHGKEVFRRNCSTCHKIADVGVDVGPSIGDARTKTPAQMLVDILMPSRAIDNNFVSYSVVTDDGTQFVGIIIAETPTSVTLKMPEAKTVSLLRSNIEALRSNGVSLMPEGLERNMTLQDMADVISFIKNWRYLSGDVPVSAK
jgi:putative membrane-bound dehydrogenase-like protein